MDYSSTKIGTFIDLRRNWAFKQIFGTPGNEDILLALIQAVLPDKGITSVSLAPTERMSINENARSAVFDVSCNTSSGDFVSVEMQFQEQDDFNDRMLNCYRLRNIQDTNTELTRSLSYVTVELPKFTKSLDELETVADKIFYSLTHISALEERPASFSEKVLVKLFELCRFANMTTEQQYLYIRTLMAEVDARSQRRTAINKTKAEIARSLREKDIPVPTIAEACGLTEEQVLAL